MGTTRKRRGHPDQDDGLPPVITLGDPGDLAAALPRLLGYRPHESLVLLLLGGGSGARVTMTMRVDLPPPAAARKAADGWARLVAPQQPAAVALVVVSEAPDEERWVDPVPAWPGAPGTGPGNPVAESGAGTDLPHRTLVHELVVALAAIPVAARTVLLVRGGRWWDYDCPHPCCTPRAGTPLPAEPLELAAASVLTGQVVERDRAALAARIAPRGPDLSGTHERTWAEVGSAVAGETTREGPRSVARRSWAAVLSALARSRPGAAGDALTEGEVARVVFGLVDEDVRDRALGLAAGPDAAAAEALWTECTRRAPAPLDASPATLLAVSAWLRGDGALANIALDRALASRPEATLPRLLRSALDACLHPAQLRELVARVAGEAGDDAAVRAGEPR